ncbi:unnamed protein product [Clonostachys chloroleuca]|uniref:Uncharacterized protein n=2 Tax=Clonostachys TaxID=110564 RepID=A0AA35Q309_9HYPO|nr:unnamed protein product [Clonostachys chloroleuca]
MRRHPLCCAFEAAGQWKATSRPDLQLRPPYDLPVAFALAADRASLSQCDPFLALELHTPYQPLTQAYPYTTPRTSTKHRLVPPAGQRMPAIQIETTAAALVAAANHVLAERDDNDNFKVIPSTYGGLYTSLNPGVIAGIVLGSVAGFLLLLFICYSALGFGPPIFSKSQGSMVEVRVRRTASRASHSSRRTSRHTRSPKRRPGGPSIVSADSYEVRTYERVHVPPPPPPPHAREPIIVDAAPSSRQTLTDSDSDSESDSEDDEVVVIEESSTPPRRRRERSYDRRRRSPSYSID